MDARKLADLLRGRVVSELDTQAEHLALRFLDGAALVFKRTPRGVSVVLHEVVASDRADSAERPTRRQAEYLDFIRKYMARHGVSPAESDIQEHFMVSAPSAHAMVKTLERRGFITRDRDIFGRIVPRSIRVLVD